MPAAELLLLVANVVYATSYAATRLTLDAVPPATLALLRAAIGWALLQPVGRGSGGTAALSRGDRTRVRWMGVVGFAGAFALFHWGLERSTATNAALLIVVEPLSTILLSPLLLGERLSRREGLGAALAVAGAVLVVLNGIPGVTLAIAPHWQGDLLLVLSGVAYASYTLIGREVLARHRAMPVTAQSMGWGAIAMLPLAAAEWLAGARPTWTRPAVLGVLYLAIVITALGYLAWNYALERVPAPRAATFLNVQPLAGAVLGAWWLGEPVTAFTAAGAALIVAGLTLSVTHGGPPAGAGESS
jgi:drug/metabolite transporter (DMT)-like permease